MKRRIISTQSATSHSASKEGASGGQGSSKGDKPRPLPPVPKRKRQDSSEVITIDDRTSTQGQEQRHTLTKLCESYKLLNFDNRETVNIFDMQLQKSDLVVYLHPPPTHRNRDVGIRRAELSVMTMTILIQKIFASQ